MSNKHIGTTLESLFDETGELWEVRLRAQKKIVVYFMNAKMKKLKVTKKELAKRMKTSRTQVDICLNPEDIGMTFSTLAKALSALGLGFTFNIEDEKPTSRSESKTGGKKTRAA